MNSADRRKALLFIRGWIGLAMGISFAGNATTNVNDVFLALVLALAAVVGTATPVCPCKS